MPVAKSSIAAWPFLTHFACLASWLRCTMRCSSHWRQQNRSPRRQDCSSAEDKMWYGLGKILRFGTLSRRFGRGGLRKHLSLTTLRSIG